MTGPMLQPSQRWWDDDGTPPAYPAPAPASADAVPPASDDAVGDGSDAAWDFSRPPSVPAAPPSSSTPLGDAACLESVADVEPDGGETDVAAGAGLRRATLVAGACALVVVLLAAGGLLAWRTIGDSRVGEARSSCLEASAVRSDAWETVTRAVGAVGDVKDVDASQVADPSTVADLAGLLDSVPRGPDADACPADATVRRLAADKERADSQADAYDRFARRLEAAVSAVVASRDAKTLADAATALKTKTDQADALLKESDGKVQDNAVRDALSKAIDQARTLLDANDDAEAMNDAAAALDRATAAVNESVKAKQDADAKAAAEAAAAQAAQQAQQSHTPSYTGGYTDGYSGGYTPSYSGGSTPSHSGGSSSGGGSVSSGSGSSPSWSVPPTVDDGLPGSDPSL